MPQARKMNGREAANSSGAALSLQDPAFFGTITWSLIFSSQLGRENSFSQLIKCTISNQLHTLLREKILEVER